MKWEYYRLEFSYSDSTEELNRLGELGWEAVSIAVYSSTDDSVILLKRPVPN